MRPNRRCIPLPGGRRVSSSLFHSAAQSTEVTAALETEDVDTIDRLLRVVREKSNPASSFMPIRSRGLWSEVLLSGTAKPSTSETPSSPSSDPITPRHMHATYTQVVLPFASSPELLEQYTNASGGLRTGMLMEHLDSLAGSIAYKHMLGPEVGNVSRVQEKGFYIVTASVERLDILAPLLPVRDIRLSGQVIYTGTSSMEVAVKMEAINPDGREETLMLGRFSMVCRDARTRKAYPVNSLVIDTPEEEALYKMGESAQKRRKAAALQSLLRVPPTSSEAAELHATHLKYDHDAGTESIGNRVFMGDTLLEKTMLMFPQERNVHQKVFGGYLMRLAYELGFANCSLFTQSHVSFLSLDGISFTRPVPIGSILRLRSQILHTSPPGELPAAVHIRVQASVVDIQSSQEEMTNEFRFTWARDGGNSISRIVVPRTYKEAMLWLEGKRALEMGAQIRGRRTRGREISTDA